MLDHFRLLAPIYDRFASPPDSQRLQALLRLPADGALLDAGGGTGRVSHQLRGLIDQVVICDESQAMLGRARAKGLAAVSGSIERLPFATGHFSRVLVVDALHHFADHQVAIAELVRVLRPGGRLVIEEPDLNRTAVKIIAIVEKLALMRSRFFYPHQIAEMVAGQGLQPHIDRSERFITWIIADKAMGN